MAIIKRAIKRKRRTRKKANFLVSFFAYIRFAPIAGIVFLFLFFQTGVKATDTVTTYVVPAISDQEILPASVMSSAYLSSQMSISASPGEYEPATFVVKANSAVSQMTVAKTNLTSGGNTISSDNIDIKVVKVWWQAGDPVTGLLGAKQLVPELLLNNDALVTVDAADNYLTVTSTAIKISGASGIGGWGISPSTDDFPVQDTATLQPVDIANGTNKQFWITVNVPAGTAAGTYSSTITLASGGITLKILTLSVRVLPITLATPSLSYNLFYQGKLSTTSTGYIGLQKSETQFTAEMQDMVKHGITNVALARQYGAGWGDESTTTLARALEIKKNAGMDSSIFYSVSCVITGCSTSTMQKYGDVAALYGATNYYVYGFDEASMAGITSSINDMHAAGIKLFAAQYLADAQAIAGYLDTVVSPPGAPNKSLALTYHNVGHKIFSYLNPTSNAEAMETYRRNYGFVLWQNDYDGEMDWAYQYGIANTWDDFDSGGSGKDENLAYPTANGVIDTVGWEGFREAVDDIRYLTTLQNLIASPPAGKSITSAQNYLTNLKAADISKRDLNTIRADIINYILYFLDQGSAPAYANVCGNGTKETNEECDGSDLNGQSCTNFGYTGGTLSCRSDCYFDKSACTPALPLLISYATSTDFANGYSNRTQTNSKINVQSTADTLAYIDMTGADQSLIGYWSFNENGGTATYDSSGRGATGTLAGATTWVAGKFGSAVHFGGSDYITTSFFSIPSGGTGLTLSAWIKTESTDYQMIVNHNGPFYLSLNGDKLSGCVYDTIPTWICITGNTSVSLNVWHQAALTYDGVTLKLFLDGALDNSMQLYVSVSPISGGGNGCLQIGRYTDGGCNSGDGIYFKGAIDELMIWKRALSPAEIKGLYNASIFPPDFSSPALSDGSHSFHAYVTDTAGNSAWSATTTINTASYSSASNLNLSGLGLASTSTFKFLAGTEWDKFSAKTSSTFLATSLDGKKLDLGTGSSLLSLTPSGGEANLYFDTANYLSGGFVNKWTVSSSVEGTQVAATIQVPQVGQNIYYEIKVNGNHYIDLNPDAFGNVIFTYGGGFTTKDFTIEQKSTPEGGYAASTIAATGTPILSATTTPMSLSTSTAVEVLKETASSTAVLEATSTLKKIIPPVINKKIAPIVVQEKSKKPGLKKVLERITIASQSAASSTPPASVPMEQPIIKKSGIFHRIWEFLKRILRFFKSTSSI